MRIFDTLFGRSRPVAANLDRLFSLPSAAVTMEADLGLHPTNAASVGFKPASSESFAGMEAELDGVLRADESSGTRWERHDDEFGYRWVTLRSGSLEDVVTAAHMVNSSLEAAGWGPQLLCSVFGFLDDERRPCHLVYLFKRGTFYPFAPRAGERRDNELELRVRAALGSDLAIEAELSRWFPLWGVSPT